MSNPAAPHYLAQLHKLIASTFSLEDVRLLCFELSVDYDELKGEAKSGKLSGLLELLAKESKLTGLLGYLERERPDTTWPAIPADFVYAPLKSDTTSPNPGPTFNLGNIEAAIVNVGGSQQVSGPIEVDLREAITILQPRGSQHREQIEQMRSQLTQREGGDQALKSLILSLLNQLEASSDSDKKVQPILIRIEGLVDELTEAEPDTALLRLSARGLGRAVAKLPETADAIKQTTAQIVNHLK
ncbi:MAG: hypothetical protein AAF633_26150 [Chloroflexota bacterium]